MASAPQGHGFQRKGQAWFCATGLPSDITVEVGEMSFHLHKFPLMSRSGKLEKLVREAEGSEDECSFIGLMDIPGGAEAFEMAAKFCYGVRVELSAANVVSLRCAANFLEMTEQFGDRNLIAICEDFLNHVVLRSWKDSVTALESSEKLLPVAEELNVIKRCVDFIVTKACTDLRLAGLPVTEDGGGSGGSVQSPGGSLLWNGINTDVRARNSLPDWWYDDLSRLSLPLYQRVISTMAANGTWSEGVAGSLTHYAKKWLPGLSHCRQAVYPAAVALMSEARQRELLETVESLLPEKKGATSTAFLFRLLRTAMILNAGAECRNRLERRIGGQLEKAVIEHLLMPNYSHESETLYDVACIRRILDHFIVESEAAAAMAGGVAERRTSSPRVSALLVSELVDGYLGEVASDANLKPSDFQGLAEALPRHTRLSSDMLYRAVDAYLKAHPWLTERQREEVSRAMECERLSVEVHAHAARNTRLPLRTLARVLLCEQLHLKTVVAGYFLADNAREAALLDPPLGLTPSHAFDVLSNVVINEENESLRAGMESMKCMVGRLERECIAMRLKMEKMNDKRGTKLWCTHMPQICESHERAPPDRHGGDGGSRRTKKGKRLSLYISHM